MTNKLSMALAGVFLLGCTAYSYASEYRYNYTISTQVPTEWKSYDPLYSDWQDKEDIYGCANWSPEISAIGYGVSFTQTATDCHKDQARTVTPREIEPRSGKLRSLTTSSYTETRQNPTLFSQSRDQVGVLQTWARISSIYSPWEATGPLYDCMWSPDVPTAKVDATINQSSTTCKSDQSRVRQDREQEQYSQTIRDAGEKVQEFQTLGSITANRHYIVKYSDWSEGSAPTGCSTWSPDPATRNEGSIFSQTARGCTFHELRTRTESTFDPKLSTSTLIGNSTEIRDRYESSSTRTAYGTKHVPVCVVDDLNYTKTVSIFTSGAYYSMFYINGVEYQKFKQPDGYTMGTTEIRSRQIVTNYTVTRVYELCL